MTIYRATAFSLFFSLLAFLSLSASAADAPGQEFPFRARYPDAPVMATAELAKRLSGVIVVDVRSEFEYQTLHIKGALNVPLSPRGFADKLKQLRSTHGNKPLVFYCNGKTCHKSYDAVLAGLNARMSDLYAYDAGIFDWAKAQPEQTTLLGKSPIRPGDLLTEEKFKAHLLEPKEFSARTGPNSIVLDVRDRVQRDSALFPFQEQRAQLDEQEKIDGIVRQVKSEGKTLLVYDAVGKQVQWLQYQFEAKGLKNYYFLKGGAQAHFDATLGKVTLGNDSKATKKP